MFGLCVCVCLCVYMPLVRKFLCDWMRFLAEEMRVKTRLNCICAHVKDIDLGRRFLNDGLNST